MASAIAMSAQSTALLNWVAATFAHLPTAASNFSAQSTDALCDGVHIASMLTEIDPGWFRQSVTHSDNWVIRSNGMKKLLKSLTQYLEDGLQMEYASIRLQIPDVNAIAKLNDSGETVKFLRLLLLASVRCANNATFIGKIQTLDAQSQQCLMSIIEEMMNAMAGESSVSSVPVESQIPATKESRSPTEMEKLLRTAAEKVKAAEMQKEALMVECERLKAQNEELHAAKDSKSADPITVLFRTEIDGLKQQLGKSEAKRVELELHNSQQSSIIAEMNRKAEESQAKLADLAHMKDELDEYRHAAEKLEKMESSLEKYKKKVDETSDLRKQLKSMEEQNQRAIERNLKLEDEYKKLSGIKLQLEEKIELLQDTNATTRTAEFIHPRANASDQKEKSPDEYQEQIMLLEERIREFELLGMPRSGGVNATLEHQINSKRGEEGGKNERIALLEEQIARYHEENTRLKLESTSGNLKESIKSAAHKLAQLTEQNAVLQRALKKAKDHIIAQDSQLKEVRNANRHAPNEPFDEAMQSLQTTVHDNEQQVAQLKKELHDSALQTRREQELMSSVWYDMAIGLQRRTNGSSTRDSSSPTSWLAQQRRNLYNI